MYEHENRVSFLFIQIIGLQYCMEMSEFIPGGFHGPSGGNGKLPLPARVFSCSCLGITDNTGVVIPPMARIYPSSFCGRITMLVSQGKYS